MNEIGTIHILVVDDEVDLFPLFKFNFRKWLSDGKIKLSFLSSADEALDKLPTIEFNDIILILSDVNMPGTNGIQFLRIVKDTYPDICVFMITAYEDKEIKDQAEEGGAEDILYKPLDFIRLKKSIGTIFPILNENSEAI